MVVIDESEEARVALRFATRRAIKTGGHVLVLAIIPPTEFIQWGGVQAAMEEEAETRAQGLLAQIAGEMMDDAGIRSEEHTSELQSLMRNSYAVYCLKNKKQTKRKSSHDTDIKTT